MTEKLKQRLVGAVVLVSLAVIFIPMLLDGGERSTMPMFGSNIPEKPNYRFEPLEIPLQAVPPIAEERPVLIDKLEPAPKQEPESRDEAKQAPKAEVKPEPKAEPKPALKPQSKPSPEPKEATAEATSATTPPASDSATTENSGVITAWVVQVGSFAQSSNALELRDKLRSNGFTAYVEKVRTEEGLIFRVRVGPEIKRENAEKQLKRLNRVMKMKGIIMGHEA